MVLLDNALYCLSLKAHSLFSQRHKTHGRIHQKTKYCLAQSKQVYRALYIAQAIHSLAPTKN